MNCLSLKQAFLLDAFEVFILSIIFDKLHFVKEKVLVNESSCYERVHFDSLAACNVIAHQTNLTMLMALSSMRQFIYKLH